jgi:hypothetical protein
MKRTYLALLALTPAAAAAGVFSSQPLDQERFAVLAQPVGKSDWKLLVLEQIKPEPLCWEKRSDGLVDPSLNRFDFSGICSRYLDSNGYSLRVGDEDLASRYRLRLEQQGSSVALLAMTPSQPTELLVGRGALRQRDRNAFVAIDLEPGWSLERRAYGSQTLSHVYFANGTPLSQLIAKANRGTADGAPGATAMKPLKPLPPQPGNGPIALQVIPYRP